MCNYNKDIIKKDIFNILNKKGYEYEYFKIGLSNYMRFNHKMKDFKPLIPETFYNKLSMYEYPFATLPFTYIELSHAYYYNRDILYLYNEEEFLELLLYLAKALPDCPF